MNKTFRQLTLQGTLTFERIMIVKKTQRESLVTALRQAGMSQ